VEVEPAPVSLERLAESQGESLLLQLQNHIAEGGGLRDRPRSDRPRRLMAVEQSRDLRGACATAAPTGLAAQVSAPLLALWRGEVCLRTPHLPARQMPELGGCRARAATVKQLLARVGGGGRGWQGRKGESHQGWRYRQ